MNICFWPGIVVPFLITFYITGHLNLVSGVVWRDRHFLRECLDFVPTIDDGIFVFKILSRTWAYIFILWLCIYDCVSDWLCLYDDFWDQTRQYQIRIKGPLHNDFRPKMAVLDPLALPPCQARSGVNRPTHPPTPPPWRHSLFMKWAWVFLREHLKNVHLKFYSKFYMECEIEFDSLGVK